MKAFPGYTRQQVRNEISYANIMLMLMSIPPYRSISSKKTNYINKKEGKKEASHWEQIKF